MQQRNQIDDLPPFVKRGNARAGDETSLLAGFEAKLATRSRCSASVRRAKR
jgi:hypothetical protein